VVADEMKMVRSSPQSNFKCGKFFQLHAEVFGVAPLPAPLVDFSLESLFSVALI